jgi:hypothetical protein
MTDRFWPKTYGAGYFVTHVVARTVLGGAIGAAVVIAIISLGGIGRDRRHQPSQRAGGSRDFCCLITKRGPALNEVKPGFHFARTW